MWVADDGRYRNGAPTRAWHKTGRAVRRPMPPARRRATRGSPSSRQRSPGARAGLSAIEAELAVLAARRERLEHELVDRPSDVDVRAAHARLAAVEAEVAATEQRLESARAAEARALAALEEIRATLVADAGDLGLPPGGEALAAIADALGRFELAAATLWPARGAGGTG